MAMKPLHRPSAVDLVIDELRREIISGALQPRQELAATRLAQQFEVSHIPVREALRALANEGLVTLHSQRAARVVGIKVSDVEEVYRLRILIEGDLVERAAPQYSDEQISTLEERFSRLRSSSSDESLGIHDAFHQALIQPSATPWDMRVLEPLWSASERHLRVLFAAFEAGDAQHEHDSLLGHAASRNGPELRRALTAHLERGLNLLSAKAHEYVQDLPPSEGKPHSAG